MRQPANFGMGPMVCAAAVHSAHCEVGLAPGKADDDFQIDLTLNSCWNHVDSRQSSQDVFCLPNTQPLGSGKDVPLNA